MNNLETLSAFGTQDTARRQTNKPTKDHKTKKVSNTEPTKISKFMFSNTFEELMV